MFVEPRLYFGIYDLFARNNYLLKYSTCWNALAGSFGGRSLPRNAGGGWLGAEREDPPAWSKRGRVLVERPSRFYGVSPLHARP